MLILPESVTRKEDQEIKEGLISHFNSEMDRVISENQHKDKFWILARVKFPKELGGNTARAFLEASDVKPPVVKESFVYEVNGRKGTKELLWTCDRQNLQIIPTKKSCSVSPT